MIVLLPLQNTGWCWIVPLLTPPLLPQPQGKVLSIMRGFLFLQISYICQIFADMVKSDIYTQLKLNFGSIESDFK